MAKKILVLYPRFSDYTHLKAINKNNDYEFVFENAFLDQIVRQGNFPENVISDAFKDTIADFIEQSDEYDGVIGTHDYPAKLVAALFAEKWGLNYPSVKSVLSCQHKYYFRQQTQNEVPEATPRFQVINPEDIAVQDDHFPLFIKPIKSSFSRHAHAVYSEEELKKLCGQPFFHPEYLRLFNEIFSEYMDVECDANLLIGEDLLQGHQVSLEGYVHNKVVHILGIIDAGMYEGSLSFDRFTYPSVLPQSVHNRMAKITRKVLKALELDATLFSIEFMYNSEDDSIHIIEINPRISTQFADFFEHVHAVNSYEILLALALGQEPPTLKTGSFAHAASFPLRLFKDYRVTQIPTAQEIEQCKKMYPDVLISVNCKVGQRLSDIRQDGNSFLYAIVNLAASSHEGLEQKLAVVMELLPFSFEVID